MTTANPVAALHAAFRATLNGAPEPEPTQFHGSNADRVAHLAPGVLPPVLDAFAREAAAQVTPSPIPLALSGLIAAAGAIRAGWAIEGPTGPQPLILWAAIVGEPSTGKSAAVHMPMAELYQIEAAWEPDDEREIRNWKLEKAGYEADFAKAIKAGKRPTANDPGPCPGRRQIIINDGTVEAVAQVEAVNPAGCIVALDELKSLVGSFGRYAAKGSGSDMEFYLSAWNGKPFRVDRKTTGRTDISNHALCVIGGIQPDVLSSAFGDGKEDNGFLARFLIASTPPAQGRTPRYRDPRLADAWGDVLRSLAAPAVGQILRLDNDAWEIFEQFNDRNRGPINDLALPALWRSHVGKWRDAWLRVAGIVHMIEHADAVRSGALLPEIGADLAGRVSRLMIEAFEPEAAAIYFGIMNRTTDRRTGGDLGIIADFILKRGKGRITWGEITRDIRSLRGVDPADGRRLLDTLSEHGWLSVRQGGGKPYWLVNPAVFSRFDARRRALVGMPAAEPTQVHGTPASDPPRVQADCDQTGMRTVDLGALEPPAATLTNWCAEIGPDSEPELIDPMGEPDPEEIAASLVAYAKMAAGCGAIGRTS